MTAGQGGQAAGGVPAQVQRHPDPAEAQGGQCTSMLLNRAGSVYCCAQYSDILMHNSHKVGDGLLSLGSQAAHGGWVGGWQ